MSKTSSHLPRVVIPCCRWWLKESQFFHLVGEKYIQAVRGGVGAQPLLLPALGEDNELEAILELADGILFTGSPSNIEPHHYGAEPIANDFNDSARDATTLPLLRAAIAAGVPILGICRGFQEMNVALGGTLYQKVHEQPNMLDHREQGEDKAQQYGFAHSIRFESDSILGAWYGADEAEVNSLHGQGVRELAPSLVAEARAPDGLIEAFRVRDAKNFAMAVQWHPEWQYQENRLSQTLFSAFARACQQRQQSRHS